jgi:hypothetical protein
MSKERGDRWMGQTSATSKFRAGRERERERERGRRLGKDKKDMEGYISILRPEGGGKE